VFLRKHTATAITSSKTKRCQQKVLPGTTAANDGHFLSRTDAEAQIVQNLSAWRVREVDGVKRHGSGVGRHSQLLGILVILHSATRHIFVRCTPVSPSVFIQRVHIRRPTQSEARREDQCYLSIWRQKRNVWRWDIKTGNVLHWHVRCKNARRFGTSVMSQWSNKYNNNKQYIVPRA